MSAKRELRTLVRARLLAVPPEHLVAWSLDLCDRLAASTLLRSARTVLAFLPLPGEPDIRPLLGRLLNDGRRLGLPRVDWAACSMTPVSVERLSDLVRSAGGPPGLLEPPAEAEPLPIDALDAILVPGIAFDGRGRRLGRGAGFYDRFLARPGIDPASVCGVAFEAQIVQDVPTDPWDVPLHAIATESRWIDIE